MQLLITGWLTAFDLPYAPLIALFAIIALIAIISLIVHGLLHRAVLPFLRRFADRSSHLWPKSIIDKKLFSRFALLMQGVLLQIQLEVFLKGDEPIYLC